MRQHRSFLLRISADLLTVQRWRVLPRALFHARHSRCKGSQQDDGLCNKPDARWNTHLREYMRTARRPRILNDTVFSHFQGGGPVVVPLLRGYVVDPGW